MNEEPLRPITDEEVAAYRRDGVVCLRALFDQAWIERMAAATDRVMAQPSPMWLGLNQGGAGRFHFDTFVWRHDADFRAFVFSSPAAAIAQLVFGSDRVSLFFDTLLVKEPGTPARTPWHHDLPYWPIEGDQVCTVWIAFDPVSFDSGAVEYIQGSHLWNKRFQPQSFTGDSRYGRTMDPMPDIEAERDRHHILRFETEPGDCIVHHGLTVHGAPGNGRADRRRRALATRWCGDDCTYKPEGSFQPLLHDPGIPSGAPMDCDLFPVVRSRHQDAMRT